jgi:hypothetical protein
MRSIELQFTVSADVAFVSPTAIAASLSNGMTSFHRMPEDGWPASAVYLL